MILKAGLYVQVGRLFLILQGKCSDSAILRMAKPISQPTAFLTTNTQVQPRSRLPYTPLCQPLS